MKKVLVILTIFIAAAAGYLYYDWYSKTKTAAREPRKTVYSWTDEKGVRHFSDKAPPSGARNIEKSKGFKYVKPPLVNQIKNSLANIYRRVKYGLINFYKKIFKTKPKGD